MFEKLIDLLVGAWHRLCPLEIIEAYNRGVVLRFGRYHRTLEPGLHWKWPVAEDVVSVLSPDALPQWSDVIVRQAEARL